MNIIKNYMKAKAFAVGLGVFFKIILPILLIVGTLGGIIFIMLSIAGNSVNEYDGMQDGALMDINDSVLEHKDTVELYADEHGVKEHVPLLLAIIMQESGGKGNDPMQSSESYCGSVGCITDPETSIDKGVKHFASLLESSNDDIKIALQSYNFGGGFIKFVEHYYDNTYSLEASIEFSAMMYNKVKDKGNYTCVRPDVAEDGACYGDVYYVDAVLKYYDQNLDIDMDGEFVKPISGAQITSPYGMRNLSGEEKMHKGIDFSCINNVSSINAVEAGEVVYSEFNQGGYGNTVIVKHGDELYTHYAHMSSIDVELGDKVKKGQSVGVCGETGRSTGPHLHFEVKKKEWDGHVNPEDLISF